MKKDNKCSIYAVENYSDNDSHGVVWRCITHDKVFKAGYSMPKKCDCKKSEAKK